MYHTVSLALACRRTCIVSSVGVKGGSNVFESTGVFPTLESMGLVCHTVDHLLHRRAAALDIPSGFVGSPVCLVYLG